MYKTELVKSDMDNGTVLRVTKFELKTNNLTAEWIKVGSALVEIPYHGPIAFSFTIESGIYGFFNHEEIGEQVELWKVGNEL